MKHHRAALSTPSADVERLLHYVPILVRAPNLTAWERQFCISLAGRRKRGPVMPSNKQIAVLRRLVDAFQEAMRDDPAVIEDGHEIGQ